MTREQAEAIIIQAYVFHDAFRMDIQGIRKRFGIPKDGFKERKELKVWEIAMAGPSQNERSTIKYQYAVEAALKRHRIPTGLMFEFFRFIAYPHTIRKKDYTGPVAIDEFRKTPGAVNVLILPYARIGDARSFINKHWSDIRKRLKKLEVPSLKKMPRAKQLPLLLKIDALRRRDLSHYQIMQTLKSNFRSEGYKVSGAADDLDKLWYRWRKQALQFLGTKNR